MFRRIVFNQFESLANQGKDPMQARVNALMMVSVLILMLLGVLALHNTRALSNLSGSSLNGLSGPLMTNLIGKLVGAVALILVFGMLFLFLGRKSRYEKYWQEYQGMDETDRTRMARSGLFIFIVPLFVLLGLFIAQIF